MNKHPIRSILKITAVSFLALGFVACGDDSSGSSDEEIKEVSKMSDLPTCDEDVAEDVFYVRGKQEYYVCKSGEWIVDDSLSVENEAKKDSSGNEGNGDGNPDDDFDDVVVDVSDRVPEMLKSVDSVTVVGYAHKGPFAIGTMVTVTGLDSAFEKTSKVFKGKVNDDKGSFKVPYVTLSSQYAMLEIEGLYMNEVSGKKSTAKIALKTLVDLSRATNGTLVANLTLLSDLETERALKLIKKNSLNVTAAKKKASQELLEKLAALVEKADPSLSEEIKKMSETKNVDEISLLDTETSGLLLYAASIAVQGNLSVTKFKSRLAEMEEQFASSGKLLNDSLVAVIADYLSETELENRYAVISENVKSMNLTKDVPDFKKILTAIWTSAYGLGMCSTEREEKIAVNKNSKSEFVNDGYTCISGRWVRTSEIDAELGFCKVNRQNEVAKVGDKSYACDSSQWRELSELENEMGLCAGSALGKFGEAKKKHWYCKETGWTEVSAEEVAFGFCSEEKLDHYDSLKSEKFVCEKKDDKFAWRAFSEMENTIGLCNSLNNVGNANGEYKGKFYHCDGTNWKEVSEVDAKLGFCTQEKLNTTGEVGSTRYVCEKDSNGFDWRKFTTLENSIGLCNAVTNTEKSKKSGGQWYYCDAKSWEKITAVEGLNGFCTQAALNKVGSADDEKFVCEAKGDSYAWRKLDDVESEIGVCKGLVLKTFKEVSSSKRWYFCSDSGWTKVSVAEGHLGFCTKENLNSWGAVKEDGKKYACENSDGAYEWREFNDLENEIGYCYSGITEALFKKTSTDKYYGCLGGEWKEVSATDFALNAVCSSALKGTFRKTSGNDWYYCAGSAWTSVSVLEGNLGFCADSSYEKQGSVSGTNYLCDKSSKGYAWREFTELENDIGVCLQKMSGEYKQDENRDWHNCYCSSSDPCQWSTSSDAAAEALYGDCNSSMQGKVVWTGYMYGSGDKYSGPNIDDQKGKFYVCYDSYWRNADGADYYYGRGRNCKAGEFKSMMDASIIQQVTGKSSLTTSQEKSSYLEYAQKMVGGRIYAACEYDVDYYGSTRIESNYRWKTISEQDYRLKSATDGDVVIVGDSAYYRSNSEWTATVCKSSNLDVIVGKSSKWRICDTDGWRELTEGEKLWETDCNASNENVIKKSSSGSPYRCEKSGSRYKPQLFSYGTFKDSRDDSTYQTLKIGSLEWMAEPLAYKGSLKSAWCYDDDNNGDKYCDYGRLYKPEDAKKACPTGWRLPTATEVQNTFKKHSFGDYGFSLIRGIWDYQPSKKFVYGDYYYWAEITSETSLGYYGGSPVTYAIDGAYTLDDGLGVYCVRNAN